MPRVGGAMDFAEMRRHWPLLVPCVGGIVLAAVNGFSLGVLIGPLEREFGWSRAEIATGPFIIACLALVLGPVSGHLIDRFGPRRTALAGTACFCLLLASLATSGPQIAGWWLRWGLLGLAALFVMPTVWVTAINSVFDRNRGLALAIALCGTGIAAAVIPGITFALVEWQGWRGAYIGLAALFALLVIPATLLLFRSPADRSAARQGSGDDNGLPGISAREGFVSPAFIKLTLAVFLFGVTSCALTANAVPVLMARGITLGEAAGLAGLIGIGSIIGRLGGGLLLDRFDARLIAAASSVMPAFCAALLLGLPGEAGPTAAACFLLGVSAGTEVDACSYLAARHFGMRSFGTLYGAINGVVLFGAGFAPLVTNHYYDLTGSYDGVLIATIPVCLIASGLFLWLGGYPVFAARPAAGAAGGAVRKAAA